MRFPFILGWHKRVPLHHFYSIARFMDPLICFYSEISPLPRKMFGNTALYHYWNWGKYFCQSVTYTEGSLRVKLLSLRNMWKKKKKLFAMIWYDVFVNCNWVVTRWQQYSTHIHRNNTQNETKQTHRKIQKFWKSAGLAPSWPVIPWHLPYNWGKNTENPQSWHAVCKKKFLGTNINAKSAVGCEPV
jgi:hypothetical protein